MNYIRKRCGHGFEGTYAIPYGGKKSKHVSYNVYGSKKTKYYKGNGIVNSNKVANTGAYVV